MKCPKGAKLISLTQGEFVIVDEDDYELVSRFKWQLDKRKHQKYAKCKVYMGIINGKQIEARIYMHRLIMRPPKGLDIDHINHNGLDNRKNNLRICTRSQNLRNKINGWGKYSKFLGVSKIVTGKRKKRWVADITIENKLKRIGYFYTEIEASKAFEAFKKENFDMGI